MSRLFQFALAMSQFLNVSISLVIGGGWADESLSARSYRSKEHKHWYKVYKIVNGVFFWQENHCEEAYIAEKNQQQLPPRYRDK